MATTDTLPLEAVTYVVWVQDLARAVRFYEQVFGLQPTLRGPGQCDLEFNGSTVSLRGGGRPERRCTGLSFQVTNAAAVSERAHAAGGTILQKPFERPGEPILLGYLEDPEGNEIMITERVAQRAS